MVMRCPCGCGEDLIANLDRRSGAAWTHYVAGKGLTLFPSYLRDTECESHFIIWNNRVYWCRDWGDEEDFDWPASAELEEMVLAALPTAKYVTFTALAKQLNLIPWDVLQ